MRIPRDSYKQMLEEGNYLDSHYEHKVTQDLTYKKQYDLQNDKFVYQKTWKIWGTRFVLKYLNQFKKNSFINLKHTFYYQVVCNDHTLSFISKEEPVWKEYPVGVEINEIIEGYLKND